MVERSNSVLFRFSSKELFSNFLFSGLLFLSFLSLGFLTGCTSNVGGSWDCTAEEGYPCLPIREADRIAVRSLEKAECSRERKKDKKKERKKEIEEKKERYKYKERYCLQCELHQNSEIKSPH